MKMELSEWPERAEKHEYRPHWFGAGSGPDEPGVLFVQNFKESRLFLSSFARWAKFEEPRA